MKILFSLLIIILCIFLVGCNSSKKNDIVSIEIETLPVKLTYYVGEDLDLTGLNVFAIYEDESRKKINLYSVDKETLDLNDTIVTITYMDLHTSFNITVLEVEENEDVYNEIKSVLTTNIDKQIAVNKFYNDKVVYINKIENPCTDGVIDNRNELLKYIEYNAFYYIKDFDIDMNYNFTNIQTELDFVYWNSNYFAGNIGLDGTLIDGQTHNIKLKYYSENKYNTTSFDKDVQNAVITSLDAIIVNDKRDDDHEFAYEKLDNKVDVYNSTQLEYALENGYGVNIIENSPAAILIDRIENILKDIIGDDMSEIQKLRQIYFWITQNAVYDYAGDEFSGLVSDKIKNSDKYASQFASFFADGVILYGNGVCHGFARAYNIMMLIEGIETVRVLGKRTESTGRTTIINLDGNEAYYTHGYNYVTIDEKLYLSDVTYAYGGTLMKDEGEIGVFRNSALLYSKELHSNLYINMTDPISSSSSYVNNFYDHILNNDIENIPNTLTAQSNFTELANDIKESYSNGAYTFDFIVNSFDYSLIRSNLASNLSEFNIYLFSSPYVNNKYIITCLIVK